MANIKFSQFTVETAKADVDFLVGYSGPDNVQISPTNLLADYPTGSGAAGQVTFFSAASTVTGDNDFYWDNTNKRLGIGTTSPSVSLHVDGFARFNGSLQLSGSNRYIYAINNTSLLLGTNNTERMRINSSGDVGIGTGSPNAKLEVDGTLIATGISQLGSDGSNVLLTSSSAGKVGIGTSSPFYKFEVSNGTQTGTFNPNLSGFMFLGSTSNHPLYFGVNDTTKMIIDTLGNVGIGTTSPIRKLHLHQGDSTLNYIQITNDATGSGGGDGVSFGITSDEVAVWNNRENTDTSISTNNTERIRITNTGNVGINTIPYSGTKTQICADDTSPSLNTAGIDDCTLVLSNSDDDYGTVFATDSSGAGFIQQRRVATLTYYNLNLQPYGGNVGIGTTNPDTILEVVNDVDNSSSPATDVNAGIIIHNGDSSGTAVLKLRGAGGDSGAVVFGNGTGAASDKFHIISRYNQTKRFTVQANGNVGIGTSSPSSNLEIDGDSSNAFIQFTTPNTNYAGIRFGDPQSINAGRIQYFHGSGALEFDAEVRFAFQGGNVGIGTDSPASKLEVDGGDIEVDDSASGLILRSPDGTRYRVTVANGGTLSVSAV